MYTEFLYMYYIYNTCIYIQQEQSTHLHDRSAKLFVLFLRSFLAVFVESVVKTSTQRGMHLVLPYSELLEKIVPFSITKSFVALPPAFTGWPSFSCWYFFAGTWRVVRFALSPFSFGDILFLVFRTSGALLWSLRRVASAV